MATAHPLIAVVDDEQSVRRALVRLLRAANWDAEAFASGEALIDSLAVRPPACVILDIHMPGLTGREVQRRIAMTGLDIPVIMMTAYDEPALREQCLAAGAIAYLCKPLRAETLLGAIENAVVGRGRH